MHARRRHPRVRFIAQMERAECGAACLAMVLESVGRPVPLSDVRVACGVNRDGTSAAALLHTGRAYGLPLKAVRCGVEVLATLLTPAILHWEGSHFVVLERADRRGAIIVDPQSGRRRVSHVELERAFSGIALSLREYPEPASGRPRQGLLHPYIAFVLEQKRALVLLLGSALCLEAFALALPTSQQLLLDEVIRPARDSWLLAVLAALLAFTVSRLALGVVRQWVTKRLQLALDVHIGAHFAAHLFSLPQRFFGARTAGDLAERIGEVAQVRTVAHAAIRGTLDLLLATGFSLLVAAHHITVGLVLLGSNLFRIAVVRLMSYQLEQQYLRQGAARGRETGTVVDGIGNAEMVHAFGLAGYFERVYAERVTCSANAALASEVVQDRLEAVSSVIDATTLGAAVWIAGNGVLQGQMSIGSFSAVLASAAFLRAPLDSLAETLVRLREARGLYSRLEDVLFERREATGSARLAALRGGVELSNVSLAYGIGKPPVFSNLNLRIEPGEKVAIVGPSGSGKSTLLRILLGTLEPSSGSVLIDGTDLGCLDRDWYRAQVGSVLQDQHFPDQPVLETVLLRDHEAGEAAAQRALDLAEMPRAKRLMNNRTLSGGERQRVAIANALCRSPKLVILDEATSALDREVERKLGTLLGRSDCTVILVTHRFDLLEMVDRVLLLRDAQLVEVRRPSNVGPSRSLRRTSVPLGSPR